jgi:hypothetical protein
MKKIITITIVFLATFLLTGCGEKPKTELDKALERARETSYSQYGTNYNNNTSNSTRTITKYICTKEERTEDSSTLYTVMIWDFDNSGIVSQMYMSMEATVSNAAINSYPGSKSEALRQVESNLKREINDSFGNFYPQMNSDISGQVVTVQATVSSRYTGNMTKQDVVSMYYSSNYSCRFDEVEV